MNPLTFNSLKGLLTLGCLWLIGACASRAADPPALVVTQSPHTSSTSPVRDILDRRYPAGTRLVVIEPVPGKQPVRILSEGLYAAGCPVASFDGLKVVFSAKAAASAEWQVYETPAHGGRWHVLTRVPGGAMKPALLPDGSVLFASPVPKNLGTPGTTGLASELFEQSPGTQPRRLTFGGSATDPTVLWDGRVLFVGSQPAGMDKPSFGQALYTINNDGTEITAFAGQHDLPTSLERPRQLADGRVAFLASTHGEVGGTAECVRLARPFQSRTNLLAQPGRQVRSVQPGPDGSLLICAESQSDSADNPHFSLFQIHACDANLGQALIEDPTMDCLEAVAVAPSQRPMGRLSNIEPTKTTGQILCLDVNDTTYLAGQGASSRLATRVRVVTGTEPGKTRVLGEAPVQADGSFMAEVPADLPLGFEALAENGDVLRRVAPMVWVRPGENRSCIGCHAEHNRAPHNHRPIAVRLPVPRLCDETDPRLAQKRP